MTSLDFAHHSAELYIAWLAAGRPAELHAYAQGGHGFGMRQQGLPVDTGANGLKSGCDSADG